LWIENVPGDAFDEEQLIFINAVLKNKQEENFCVV
jgi:hypothetical protein